MREKEIKILVVEDDAAILYGLSAKIAAFGFSVLSDEGLGDIKDIWAKISRERPDYIVLDLILPGFDGRELLGRLKADPVLSLIPVFIFTNFSDADTRAYCQILGADYYFVKSEFNIDKFADKLKKIVLNLEKSRK